MPILTQQISVEFHKSGSEPGILYKPYALDREQPCPPPSFHRVAPEVVKQNIADIRETVQALLQAASGGRGRGQLQIEQVARTLANSILPQGGLTNLMAHGTHPQIDTTSAGLYEVPWETLEESYTECSKCHERIFAQANFCSKCGNKLQLRGGKLALAYQLSYFTRGRDWTTSRGNRVLLIGDPRGDLCDTEKDLEGYCRDHLTQIEDLVDGWGYDPVVLNGENASRTNVLDKLRDPSIVGVYYFGHGYFSTSANEGCLLLANEAELYASEIQNAAPSARLVFLNACWGGAAGSNWDIEHGPRNVAEAFLQGNPNKVVIAPLFPVIARQAAQTALTFYSEVVGGASCGEALREARQQSLESYNSGEADISWMAYRFFGDPNTELSAAKATTTPKPTSAKPAPLKRIFDLQGKLNLDLFSFAVDDVLLRAVKRKTLQGCNLVRLADLIAGLVRRSDLTRYVLIARGHTPDDLYDRLCAQSDLELGLPNHGEDEVPRDHNHPQASPSSASDGTDEHRLEELFGQWIVRDASQLTPRVVDALRRADVRSQLRAGPSEQICEQDLLLEMIDMPEWKCLCEGLGLPSTEEVQTLLCEREATGRIDGNGALLLPSLTLEAKRIIEIAHALAQQGGLCPIPNRVMLAAFLQPDDSYAARCFEQAGVDPFESRLWMLAVTAVSSSDNPSKHWFGLSLEAGQRILLPTIEYAQTHAGDIITERDLFQGFCEAADDGFKKMIKELLDVDLSELLNSDCDNRPDWMFGLSLEARRVIIRAHKSAQERGVFPIPSRLVLVAFLSLRNSLAGRLLRQQNISPDDTIAQLIGVTGYGSPQKYLLDESACERAVHPMIKRSKALAHNGDMVTESLLFQAFCEASIQEFKDWLKGELHIDLDILGQLATTEEAKRRSKAKGTPETDTNLIS